MLSKPISTSIVKTSRYTSLYITYKDETSIQIFWRKDSIFYNVTAFNKYGEEVDFKYTVWPHNYVRDMRESLTYDEYN